MTSLRTWYIATYRDQFFVTPPAWFDLYMYMELIYHVPLSLWAVGALLRDDPKIPIHLIIYAMQTAITTATCIADFLSWSDISAAEKVGLGQLYGPYLALCRFFHFSPIYNSLLCLKLTSSPSAVFMGVDMYSRLVSRVGGGKAGTTGKKTN